MASNDSSQAEGVQHLRVLTFNCWGLKFVSKQRELRIQALADYLTTPLSPHLSDSPSDGPDSDQGGHTYDVICLQEIWVREDFVLISRRLSEVGLIHSRFFFSGALGSGLAIISRFPLRDSSMFSYPLNGSPLHVGEGDWHVGKGAASAVLEVDRIGEVEVFNTHFHAPGGEGPEEWKRAHRLAQAWELSKLVNASAERGRYVIVCGDLNSRPTSLVMRLLLSSASLNDSFPVSHPHAPPSTSSFSQSPHSSTSYTPSNPTESLRSLGVTCDSPFNSWTAGKNLSDVAKREFGKRLDYVLFREASWGRLGRIRNRIAGAAAGGNSSSSSSFQPDLKKGGRGDYYNAAPHASSSSSSRTSNTAAPGAGAQTSERDVKDEEDFKLMHDVPRMTCTSYSTVLTSPIQGYGISISDHFGVLTTLTFTPPTKPTTYALPRPPPPPSREILTPFHTALTTHLAHTSRTSNSQLRLFIACIILVPVLMVSASFQPLKYLNWIWVALGVAVGFGGTTMLYVGFLAGRWEVGGLRNVLNEVEGVMGRVR